MFLVKHKKLKLPSKLSFRGKNRHRQGSNSLPYATQRVQISITHNLVSGGEFLVTSTFVVVLDFGSCREPVITK